ncbi:MAG TPA: sugar ABC transporter permease [Candidatus Limnocylindrales bacterium]|nr:sugar ABC transporter permease [Candidatus Limnocylindrales bacterium]
MRDRMWVAYAFLAPVLVVMAIIVLYPLALSIWSSFTDLNRANAANIFREGTEQFIGLDNYIRVLTSEDFRGRFVWTVIWTAVNVTFHFTFGLGLALLLNQRFRGRTAYRLVLMLPWAIPAFISAVAWRYLFNGQYGFINQFLAGFGIQGPNWLSDPFWAYVAPIIVNVWLGVPFMMVALLGGLQSIPADLYEAARVDGASRRQTFWNVTLPQLKSVSVAVTMLGVIWTFNLFVVIFLTTGGGPGGRTRILVVESFAQFQAGQFALAATYSVVILSLLLLFVAAYQRAFRTEDVAK